MPRCGTFPIWTQSRAQRHLDRGCSQFIVGLILRPNGRPPSLPAAEALPSNVLPFRTPDSALRSRTAPALERDLRHG